MKNTTTATPPPQDFTRSRKLQAKAHSLIPGGCHTYAKGDDQYPLLAPGFIERGYGSHVWDVDGNEFIEYGMGSRCVTLGHAFAPVVEAAQKEMLRGSNFGRPARIEVECAEQFLRMMPRADMVKFTKNGSDATSAAVRLSRAATGRDLIALCGDHPFFSVDDWFIGTTAINTGIPEAIRNLSLMFRYNDLASVQVLFDQHPGQIACLIMEPAKYAHPAKGFLHDLRDLCHRNGAIFILDEMITGFRWDNGGAQQTYDIAPDLSTFGKALGNGFALSALAGKRELMERGGMTHERERVFLLSTTNGAETHAMAAGIATMQTYQREPVIETIYRQGSRLQNGLRQVIDQHQLTGHVKIEGLPCSLIHVAYDQNKQSSQAFRTLLLQELIKRGVLAPSLVLSYMHTDDDIDHTIEAFDGALAVYKNALDRGVEHFLVGPPSKSVYRKFN
ncbi:MAG: glutamate-1-semialdehyde 2,1-aminomutase [Porticoccaceae bacterium]